MADTMTRLQRSHCMSKIRSRDTKPELALRRVLFAKGMRYRTNLRLAGRPDIVFTRAKLAVFVDGCFWHGCPLHGTMPKSNQDYWTVKLERNRARDLEAKTELERNGWCVVRFWSHEIEDGVASVADAIYLHWRERSVGVQALGGCGPQSGEAESEIAVEENSPFRDI